MGRTSSVGRLYKDKKTDQWRESRTFSDTDLLKIQTMIPEVRRELNKWRDYHREVNKEQDAPKKSTPLNDMLAQSDAIIKGSSKQSEKSNIQEHPPNTSKDHSR